MLDRLERALVAVNRFLLIGMLGAMSLIVFVNVVMRYTTGDSLVWAEEVARHLMIWTTFLGAGLVLRFGGHVAVENLHQSVPSLFARVLRCVVAILVAGFCGLMAYSSLDYLEIMQYQTTPSTGLPFSYIYVAIPAGFSLLVLHLAFIVRRYVRDGAYVESDEMDADAAASL